MSKSRTQDTAAAVCRRPAMSDQRQDEREDCQIARKEGSWRHRLYKAGATTVWIKCARIDMTRQWDKEATLAWLSYGPASPISAVLLFRGGVGQARWKHQCKRPARPCIANSAMDAVSVSGAAHPRPFFAVALKYIDSAASTAVSIGYVCCRLCIPLSPSSSGCGLQQAALCPCRPLAACCTTVFRRSLLHAPIYTCELIWKQAVPRDRAATERHRETRKQKRRP